MKAWLTLLSFFVILSLVFVRDDGSPPPDAPQDKVAAVVDPVDEGCPQTSNQTVQDAGTLQTFLSVAGTTGIVYSTTGTAGARLQLQLSGGVFSSTNFATTSNIVFVCAADFDNDGKEDFIGANDQAAGEIALYRNLTTAPVGFNWNSLTSAVTPNFVRTYGNVTSGNGSFIEYNCNHVASNTGQSCTGGGVGSLACGDFNADGNQDFAWIRGASIPSTSALRFQIYLGNGNRTFQTPYTATTNTLNYFKIGRGVNLIAADVNKDNKLDLMFGGVSQSTGGVSVWLNNGATPPKFTAPLSPLVSSASFGSEGVTGLAYGKFSNDTFDDLVITGANVKKVSYYAGTGVGTVSSSALDITSAFVGGGTFIAPADYSSDGNLDIAIGTDNFAYLNNNTIGGKVYWWKSDNDSTPFSSAVITPPILNRPGTLQDLDLGTSIQYDNDPGATRDIIAADGNDASKFYILSNHTVSTYVTCGDVVSSVLDLGTLASTEMVVTSGRMTPDFSKPTGTTIQMYMSNEEPANWQPASPCSAGSPDYCVTFPKPVGRYIRWKAHMCSNSDQTQTPYVRGATIKFDYTTATKHFRAGAITHDGVTYVGAFKQPGSRGNLYAIDTALTSTKWDAAAKLDALADSSRRIFGRSTTNTLIEYTTANGSTTPVKLALNASTTLVAQEIITWLRSARFGVTPPLSRLGSLETGTPSVVDEPTEPLYYDYLDGAGKALSDSFRATYSNRKTLAIFGSRDGMIHAIYNNPANNADPENGVEKWAYVPTFVAKGLASDKTNNNSTLYPDGSPTIADVKLSDGQYHTIALVGSGNGGRYISALDVTQTITSSGTVVGPTPLWEIQPGGATSVGLTYIKPAVARVKINNAEKFIAILASGLAPEDTTSPYSIGRVVSAVDMTTGTTLWQFDSACAVTSDLAVFETDDVNETGNPKYDGYADRVAWADACGNLYKVNPAQDLAGGWITSSSWGLQDTGVTTVASGGGNVFALFSTKTSACGMNDYRPIAGTLGSRQDETGRFAIYFGTGGVESFDPYKQNAFFSIYADTGEVRGCSAGQSSLGKVMASCDSTSLLCEKFYGGVVVTTDQVLATRAIDPPIAQNTCTYGSSKLVSYNLNDLSAQFTVLVASSTVSALYGIGGAVYFTTLAGDVVRVGSATAAGTSGGSGGEGGSSSTTGGSATGPLTVAGWREIEM